MALSEADFMRRCMKRATELGARLFRMNIGTGWVGEARQFKSRVVMPFTFLPGDVLIRNARPFKSGVPGMSDLVGFVPVTITEDMVGQRLAVYAAVETKSATGRATDEQRAFIGAVSAAGGRAGIARKDDDLTIILYPERSLAPVTGGKPGR